MASSKAHGAASLQSCYMGISVMLAATLGSPGLSSFHQSTLEFIHRVSPEESPLAKTSTLLSCLAFSLEAHLRMYLWVWRVPVRMRGTSYSR